MDYINEKNYFKLGNPNEKNLIFQKIRNHDNNLFIHLKYFKIFYSNIISFYIIYFLLFQKYKK